MNSPNIDPVNEMTPTYDAPATARSSQNPSPLSFSYTSLLFDSPTSLPINTVNDAFFTNVSVEHQGFSFSLPEPLRNARDILTEQDVPADDKPLLFSSPTLLPINTFDDAFNDLIEHQDFEISLPSPSSLLESNDSDSMNEFFNFPAVDSIAEFHSEQPLHHPRDVLKEQDALEASHDKLKLSPQNPSGVDIQDRDNTTENNSYAAKQLEKLAAVPPRSDSALFSESEPAPSYSNTGDTRPDLTRYTGDSIVLGVNEIPTQLVPFAKVAVRLLLGRNGIDADPSTLGRRVLRQALEEGDEVAVRMLLTLDNIELNPESVYSLAPLIVAAENGHEGVVHLLLGQHDVIPDIKDDRGQTPIWCAARKGHAGVVRLLLERNDVDINGTDDHVNGRTPLMIAAMHGHEGVVRLLLERVDIDPDIPDKHGETPLWCAAWFGHAAVVQLLLKRNGINTDPKNEMGDTILWWSAFNGHSAIVQLLLQRDNVDPNQQTDSTTPLMVAAWRGHEAVVRVLLSYENVKPDIYAPCGWSALTFAAYNSHEAVVRLLTKQDNVNADESLSFTASRRLETVPHSLWKQGSINDNAQDKPLGLAIVAEHVLRCVDSSADGRVCGPQFTSCMKRKHDEVSPEVFPDSHNGYRTKRQCPGSSTTHRTHLSSLRHHSCSNHTSHSSRNDLPSIYAMTHSTHDSDHAKLSLQPYLGSCNLPTIRNFSYQHAPALAPIEPKHLGSRYHAVQATSDRRNGPTISEIMSRTNGTQRKLPVP